MGTAFDRRGVSRVAGIGGIPPIPGFPKPFPQQDPSP
jgi:hypothetical protein